MSGSVLVYSAQVIGVGLGATVFMDLWNLFLKHAFGVPSLDFCFLGRWIRHMPSGTFRHPNIALAPPKALECHVGWIAHYSIGLTMGAAFVLLARDWIAMPTFLPALAFGVGTVVMPFLVLQPALGLGVASARAKNPAAARLKSLATHTAFGIGLYLSARAISYALRLAEETIP